MQVNKNISSSSNKKKPSSNKKKPSSNKKKPSSNKKTTSSNKKTTSSNKKTTSSNKKTTIQSFLQKYGKKLAVAGLVAALLAYKNKNKKISYGTLPIGTPFEYEPDENTIE